MVRHRRHGKTYFVVYVRYVRVHVHNHRQFFVQWDAELPKHQDVRQYVLQVLGVSVTPDGVSALSIPPVLAALASLLSDPLEPGKATYPFSPTRPASLPRQCSYILPLSVLRGLLDPGEHIDLYYSIC